MTRMETHGRKRQTANEGAMTSYTKQRRRDDGLHKTEERFPSKNISWVNLMSLILTLIHGFGTM